MKTETAVLVTNKIYSEPKTLLETKIFKMIKAKHIRVILVLNLCASYPHNVMQILTNYKDR